MRVHRHRNAVSYYYTKCVLDFAEDIYLSKRRSSTGYTIPPDHPWPIAKCPQDCEGCDPDKNFKARLLGIPDRAADDESLGTEPMKSAKNEPLWETEAEPSKSNEAPERFEMMHINNDGAVIVKLEGYPDSKILYTKDAKKRGARIMHYLCFKGERDMKLDALGKVVDPDKIYRQGTIKTWAGELRSDCRVVFGDLPAKWNKIIRTEGDLLIFEVKKKPWSKLIETCGACGYRYKPDDESSRSCQNCGAQRDRPPGGKTAKLNWEAMLREDSGRTKKEGRS